MATLQELREKHNYTPPSDQQVSRPRTLEELRAKYGYSTSSGSEVEMIAAVQSEQINALQHNLITAGMVTIVILTLFIIVYFISKKIQIRRLSSFIAWRLFTVVYGLIATFMTGLVVILCWSASNQSVYMSSAIATLLVLESFLVVVTIYRFTAILVNYVIYGNGGKAMTK